MLKIMFGSSLSSLIRAEDEDNLVLLDLSYLYNQIIQVYFVDLSYRKKKRISEVLVLFC